MTDDQQTRQRAYYEETAEQYADLHIGPGDEHFVALEYATALLSVVRAESVLDVGSGTGRGVRFVQEQRPDLRVVGLEPSDGLRTQAEALGGEYVAGGGEELPFPDDSFDIVLATALMHHLPDPAPVLAEMMRVAKFGIMISDSNRFGQGSVPARALKPIIHKAGLWPTFEKLRTRGKGYMESESDGVFYSYSIYDSMPALSGWASRCFVIPTSGHQSQWRGAYLGATHGLLVALREPTDGWAGR